MSLPITPLDPAITRVTVMHSGGLDSLAALYWMLKNTDVEVFSVFVRMMGHSQELAQKIAVERQWAWLQKNVRSFETHISVYEGDYQNFSDPRIVVIEAAKLAKNDPYLKVMTGRCEEDSRGPLQSWDMFDADFAALSGRQSYLEVRVPAPVRDWPKKALGEMLPAELLAMIWGCRTPTAELKPCGSCHTCLQYDQSGLFEKIYGMPRPPTESERRSREEMRRERERLLTHGPMGLIPGVFGR